MFKGYRMLVFSMVVLLLCGAAPASAISRGEFLPGVFEVLGAPVPDGLLSGFEEPEISKRFAVRLILEAMGWGFETLMYEQLTLLPELSSDDALASIAGSMSPPVPAAIRDSFEEALAEEDMVQLLDWLALCITTGVSWSANFSYEGTTLTLYKRGVGNPVGPASGNVKNGVNEPLYVAMLTVDMRLVPCQIATAVMAGGKRLELSRIAEENYGVIGGINGGYFAGEKPIGTLRRQGYTDNAKFWPYRSAFGWNEQGEFIFIDGKVVSQIEGNSAFDRYTEILQAGPLLLKDGTISPNVENISNNVINNRHPRTVVGTDGGRVMWVVIDGRSNMHSVGTTIEETRAICQRLGMKTALNLDGGGSSSLWWRGMTFSQPSNSKEAERPIPYAVLMFQQGYGVRQ